MMIGSRSRICVIILLSICMLIVPISALTGGPDSFGYTFIDSSSGGPAYSWIDITTSGTQVLPDNDDDEMLDIPLGFVFNYYGIDHGQLNIANNGLILSTAQGPFTNGPIGNSPDFHEFIAPYWDDLVTSNSRGADAIYYATEGTAPNRRFIVEWNDNYHFGTSYTSGITFEAILYEGSNDIKFQYQDVDFGDSTINNGASATIGIENPAGDDGLQYSFNTPAIQPELAILFKYPVGTPDTDGDGIPDAQDNCPNIFNPDQLDSNRNGVGDVCESIPGIPEFPSLALPASMIIGFLGAVLLIQRTREH